MTTTRIVDLLLVVVIAVSLIGASGCTKIKHRKLINIHETFEGDDGDDWIITEELFDPNLAQGEASATIENGALNLFASQDHFCAKATGAVFLSLNTNIEEVHRIELKMDFASSSTPNEHPRMYIRIEEQEFEFDGYVGYDGKLCFVWEKDKGHKIKIDRKELDESNDLFVGINENSSGISEVAFVAQACAGDDGASCSWVVRDLKLNIWGS